LGYILSMRYGLVIGLALLGLKPVTWTGAVAPAQVAAGGMVNVRLTAAIDDGWHLYSTTQPPGGPVPTRIAVASPRFALEGSLAFPKPSVHADPNFGINVETYETGVTFTVPVRVDKAAPVGTDTVVVTARYQACNATLCLPPQTAMVAVPVKVTR
jgi:DsbC/DsbD-like thiol-disulfide interchange protein